MDRDRIKLRPTTMAETCDKKKSELDGFLEISDLLIDQLLDKTADITRKLNPILLPSSPAVCPDDEGDSNQKMMSMASPLADHIRENNKKLTFLSDRLDYLLNFVDL